MPAWWGILLASMTLALLLGICSVGVWRILGKVARSINSYDESDPPTSAQKSAYNAVLLALFFCTTAIMTIGWFAILQGVELLLWQTAPNGGWVTNQDWLYWALFAFFPGMLHATLLIDPICRRMFPDYERLVVATASSGGSVRAARKVIGGYRAMLLLITATTGVAIALGWTWFVRVDADSITVGRPFAFHGQRYTPDEIAYIYRVRMLKAPNGANKRNEHVVIEFADGSYDRFLTNIDNFAARLGDELVAFAGRNAIPVMESEWYPPRISP